MGQRWAVVLAAGEGKRMHSRLPKVLHPLCGRPMLGYILNAVWSMTQNVIVVVGHGAAQIEEVMGPRWRYVLQQKQLGTGDALMQALPFLPEEGLLLVLCGDTPLLDEALLKDLLETHGSNAATIMTATLSDPAGYGRVIQGAGGQVIRIAEDKDASADERRVQEINTGAYCFNIRLLKQYLPHISADNKQGEYYLTDIISLFTKQRHRVGTYRIQDYRVGIGINDRTQLAEASKILRERINDSLMRQGVTMLDPGSVYIDYGVSIGADTVIWPQSIIEGCTEIGRACLIGPGVYLRNVRIGDAVTVRHSVVEDTVLPAAVTVEPFSYVRAGNECG